MRYWPFARCYFCLSNFWKGFRETRTFCTLKCEDDSIKLMEEIQKDPDTPEIVLEEYFNERNDNGHTKTS